MVNFKRKVSSEKDIYIDGYDSVIEVEPIQKQVYKQSQRGGSYADNTYTDKDQGLTDLSYTPIKRTQSQAVYQTETHRPSYPKAQDSRQAKLYDVKKSSPAKSEAIAVNSKTKLMLFTYLVAAIILATVVIVTGVMLRNASDNASALEGQLAAQNYILANQDTQLAMLHDDTYLRGLAMEMDMELNDVLHQVDLLEIIEPVHVESSTNWFDRFTRFFARLFTRA